MMLIFKLNINLEVNKTQVSHSFTPTSSSSHSDKPTEAELQHLRSPSQSIWRVGWPSKIPKFVPAFSYRSIRTTKTSAIMADEGTLTEYLWIVVVGCIFGFVYAFGIGANDVANAFASSVSSKSLTLKQAIICAGIFEFCGALFLGAAVADTIRGKLIDVSLYEDQPEILLLGMFTSIFTATFMLLGATYFGLPVSTTHTIVGCIIGFSVAAEGFDSVDMEGTKKIFISWIVSPLISGTASFILFGLLRLFVLRTEHSYQRAYYTFPIVLFVGIFINVFYILKKVGNNFDTDELPKTITFPSAAGAGVLVALLWIYPMGPYAKKRVEAGAVVLAEGAAAKHDSDDAATHKTARPSGHPVEEGSDDNIKADVESEEIVDVDKQDEEKSSPEQPSEQPTEPTDPAKRSSMLKRASQSFAENTYKQDLHRQSMEENAGAKDIWDNAEKYDENAEMMFTYLQVFTACLNSFAHGANDVANAIAPVSAMIYIYQTGVVDTSKVPVQKWILAYGGIGIVLGLLLYGYKVMKSIGYKLTMMSPSRGACAELAASLTVVTASYFELPVSSTQVIVGAVSGIGLAQGWRNVQWLFLLRVCVGWVVIFFVSAVLSAGVFSFMAYSPSLM